MQFCQPAFTGYAPNYPPCNPPPFQYNGYPEIIGEGHVTSTMLPDGSIQYLFLPTTHWWRPQPCNPTFGNNNTQWNNNNGAWFIRSAYTPMQPPSYQTMCSPSFQGPCGFQTPLPVTSNSCIELHKTNYQMKFHNDGCTSTSDIHYFYPALRNWFHIQRSCASCQTETSTTNSSSQNQESIEVICHRLCKCSDRNKPKEKDECMCCSSDSNTSTSKMSLEKPSEIKTKCSKKKKAKENDDTRPSTSKGHKTKVECMCYISESNTKISKNKKSKENDDSTPKGHKTKVECMCYNSDSNTKTSKNKKSKENDDSTPKGHETKEKQESMCYSSDSNVSTNQMSLEKSSETKTKKYENKKPKESSCSPLCECASKGDKTKEKPSVICSNNSQSADKKPQTKSGDSSQNKKVHSKEPKKVICKCKESPQRDNKSVTTYNEQGSNCGDQFGRETQTKNNADAGSMTDLNRKKPIKKTSYTICGEYASCLGTSCSCYTTSETESDRSRPSYSKKKKTK